MLGSLIAGFASGETLIALRRAKSAAIAYAVAALLAFAAIIFLIIAGYIWLARRYGAIEAGLGIGGSFILLAVIVIVAHKISARSSIRQTKKRRSDDVKKIAIATGIAVLPTLLRGRAGPAVLLAPAIAAVAYAIYRENAAPRGDKDPD